MSGLWLGSWFRYATGTRLAPFVPTPQHIVSRMLALASCRSGDILCDVGSGDGRLLIAAARLGASGFGYELNSRLVKKSRAAIESAGFAASLVVHEEDALKADLSDASLVSLFVSDTGNAAMLPTLARAAAKRRATGAAPARVVTFHFEMPPPMRQTAMQSVDGTKIYVYTLDEPPA